ncbi:MAG: hypothetical protein HOC70_10365 [Gammaproteobacteria bacterium]|jgi:putative dimethyl sulfoxide reductase chaperone|nr:hypothetical protein [Gammaproteobacteria bacterium]MBT4493637.1 hypothetical protein [Gammaproteobacteria bacterium]MBT7371933.1 hypothetical protein [Gammaproteobacteria bacterium]
MFVYTLDGLEIDGDQAQDIEIEDNEITARSGVYGVFSKIFTLPNDESYTVSVNGAWPAQLREVAALLAFDTDFGVAALSESVSQDEYAAGYQSIFEAENAPAAILSGEYGDGDRQTRVDEIKRIFEYFGLKASNDAARSPDHLATGLEFMQYLAFKEAASASPRLAGSFHRAQEEFLERHLIRWLPEFADRVEAVDALPIWVWASQAVSAFTQSDLDYLSS